MGLEQLTDTALHEAVRFGDISEVRQAINDGCDPDQIGVYQWSPLHEAAHNGDLDIVQLLVEAGGDANKRDVLRGCTAVHYAAMQGYTECLRLLLKAGGRHDVLNNSGKSCHDVATKDCKLILDQQKDESEICLRKKKERIAESEEVVQHENEAFKSLGSDTDSLLEVDSVSMATSNGSNSSCSRACSTESVWSASRDPVLGHIQLSFEYNAKKQTLKIRVWQLQDLLLPPADTSMISHIYVKSYLQPDKKKSTRQKTEELPAYTSSAISRAKTQPSDAMTSSCFKFTRPLEYSSITPAMVSERIVDINVCITQKYTRRSFTIATWHMQLDEAVRKLRKEKFTLRPKIRAEIPDNMKMYYCPSELSVCGASHRDYSSDPNLRRTHSSSSCSVPHACRAASDSDLNQVAVGNAMGQKMPSIEITMPPPEEELEDALRQIMVMEKGERSRSESSDRSRSGSNDEVVEMYDLDGVDESNTIQVEVYKTNSAMREKSVGLREVKIVDGAVARTSNDQAVNVEETDCSVKTDSGRLRQVKIVGGESIKDVVIPMHEGRSSRVELGSTGETIEMSSLDRYLSTDASLTAGKQKRSRKKKTVPKQEDNF